jgi:hypothetical protein
VDIAKIARTLTTFRHATNATMIHFADELQRFAESFEHRTEEAIDSMRHGVLRSHLMMSENLRIVEQFEYSLILQSCLASRLPASTIFPNFLQTELTSISR